MPPTAGPTLRAIEPVRAKPRRGVKIRGVDGIAGLPLIGIWYGHFSILHKGLGPPA